MKADNLSSGLLNELERPDYKYKFALLIDDNYIDNFISERILRSFHFSRKTFIAANGRIALDHIDEYILAETNGMEQYPDIILVDLNMPVMDGFEFIQEFRKIENKRLRKCKIVVLTSSIHPDDRKKVLGIDSSILFFSKPITIEMLNKL